jgi:protocatechuate 3,4-dioxygenase beta subunit
LFVGPATKTPRETPETQSAGSRPALEESIEVLISVDRVHTTNRPSAGMAMMLAVMMDGRRESHAGRRVPAMRRRGQAERKPSGPATVRRCMRAKLLSAIVLTLAATDACAAEGTNERQVGGPCEGCEAVFDGQPARWTSSGRIAPEGSAGEPLILEGTVRDAGGRAVAGVIVYAYQTDAGGIYPRPEPSSGLGREAVRHGRFRGFVRSDERGHYRFDTIRPGGYPDTEIPQHIHMHVIEPRRCTYWIDDVVFDDDPRLTERQRRTLVTGRGGDGLVVPRRDAAGWSARRDIVLGAGITDYASCAR